MESLSSLKRGTAVSRGVETTEFTLAKQNSTVATRNTFIGLAVAAVGVLIALTKSEDVGLAVVVLGGLFAVVAVMHMLFSFSVYARSRAGVKSAAADAEKPIIASHVSYAQDIRRSV